MLKLVSVILLLSSVVAETRSRLGSDGDTLLDGLKNEAINYRLSEKVIPESYVLELTTHLKKGNVTDKNFFKYEGSVKIKLKVESKQDNIILHSRNLTIESIVVMEPYIKDGINHRLDTERDFLIISRKDGQPLEVGKYELRINFESELGSDMRGFYRSSYKRDNGAIQWLATTHFEPVGARRAFPCFDEPKFKATFDISITHDNQLRAVSNTPFLEKTNITGTNNTKTTFKQTPKMSTYLVALLVSDFKNRHQNNTRFRVLTRENAIENSDLAVTTGEKLLKALEDYTGIPYFRDTENATKLTLSMDKMDQAAIPDFRAGAMENWGLVLYKEGSLLYNENKTATSDLQNIVQTIAHEFAHQWFGNLISPKWWQYVWLNEGFANFFQSLITEKVNPEWRSIDQSVVSSIQTTAFNADSKDSKPLNHNVNSPEEISNKFDSISYQKGGAVIRMMQHFLTEKIFQEGIQNYLKKNQFKAADSDDLFSALQEIVDKNNFTLPDKVKEIMNSWVNSPGYPVITVNRASDDKIKIKQERFITYKNEHGNDVSNTWHIPINYVVGSKPNFTETLASEWLTGAEKEITVEAQSNEWIILNKQQTGYYRVDYDEKSWELIIKHLNSADEAEIKKIHVLNRAQLTNDALALAQQGKLRLRSLLDLIAYLKNETDYIAWNPGFKTISWLNEKLANTDYYPELKSFLLDKFSKIMNKTGLEETKEDDHLTKLNRKTVVDWACYLGDKGCTDKMNSRLGAWLNDSTKNPISEDMKKITLCHGLRLADENTWYRVFNKTLITTDETEKNQLIEGMTCTNDKKLLEYLLNYTLENNSVYNDTLAVVKSVRDNSNIGVDTVIDFVTSRTTRILIKYEKKERLTEFLRAILEKISIEAQLQQFLKAIDEDIPDVIIADAKASAEANINWLKKNSATLQSWVEDVHKTQKDNGAGMISASLGLVLSLLLIAFNNMK